MKYGLEKRASAASLLSLLVAVLLSNGCGQKEEQTTISKELAGTKAVPSGVLAVVGDRTIDMRQLREYEAEIQPVHKSTAQGIDRHRDHLLSLIDEKLIIREAERGGFGEDPQFKESMRFIEHKSMVETYLHQTVGQNIRITEEELRESFESHPARFAVRGAHILVETRERADSLFTLITSGKETFEDMAKAYSLDDSTAANGGMFNSYYAYDRVSDQVYQEVFSKEVGNVSEPFRTALGWELAKVIDKKEVPYEKYRTVIQRATMMAKFNRLKGEHIDSLQHRLNLEMNADNLRAFLSAWNKSPGSPDLSPALFAAPMYTFEGGEISLEQVMYVLTNTGIGSSTVDSAQVDERIRTKAAPDLLLAEVARRAGFAENPSVLRQLTDGRERKLLEEWWKDEMEKAVEVDESEARAHYEKHPERYKIPEEIIFQEIMVADKATAEDLMKQIRAGADMADLATRHSIRRYADENGGLYAMRAFERMVYQELMDAAVEAPTDELMGPIQLKEPMPSSLREPRKLKVAYSVFKVLERLPERVQTFEASREKAMFYARQAKQQERVERLTANLRNKYVAEWGINDEELTRYTESVTGG
ncbi:MAG: hypothetical protein CME28_01525 [Gemmatimonadetes bacterium]|nr:hypothetical protein [Gemmatimonadota bacterium]|tara:strand:- start:966 stop:2741 length:1776 start_codon:yes stop_codon:yes gene_type:complete